MKLSRFDLLMSDQPSAEVRGEFNLQSDNHGKPVYKKNGQAMVEQRAGA